MSKTKAPVKSKPMVRAGGRPMRAGALPVKVDVKAAAAPKSVAAKKPRKAALAHGVEPITEGPYANSGPLYEARVAAGNVQSDAPPRMPPAVVTA